MPDDVTVGAALLAARGRIPAGEARMFLCRLLGIGAAQVAAYPERGLSAVQSEHYAAWLERRLAGEPMAYILGEREFYGRRFQVSPAVLIPRPETELIVDLVRERVCPGSAPRILDLGTGSGALAVTLALEIPGAQVTAVDLSPAALAAARGNAVSLGATVRFIASDWFSAVDATAFDFIVSNPPYIADEDPHLDDGDVRFEPRTALASGPAGLDDLRRITLAAPAFLVSGGWLFMEHGYDQAAMVRDLLVSTGFQEVASAVDLAGIERTGYGRRP